VIRLLTQLNTGLGVLEEAIPAPSAGWRINSGARTVTIPTVSAGNKVGFRAHSNPYTASKSAAKVTPME
jgi:hypothetical protein